MRTIKSFTARTFGPVLVAGALATTGCQQQAPLGAGLVTGEQLVTSIAVDGGSVYWTRADGTVKKVSLSSGQVATIGVYPGLAENLVLDDDSLYWSVGSSLLMAPKAGGAPVPTMQKAKINGISLDDTYVYWTAEDNTVDWMPKKGSKGVAGQVMADDPSSIVAGTANVYWGAEAADGALFQMSAGGGAATPLLQQGDEVSVLALGADQVFWGTASNADSPDGVIEVMALDGTNPRPLATGQRTSIGLMADASHVYWSNADGQVQVVSISGGDAQSLVQGPTQCSTSSSARVSIAMDATNIYWANACDDGIYTMTKL